MNLEIEDTLQRLADREDAHQYRLLQARELIESATVTIDGRVFQQYVETDDGRYIANPAIAGKATDTGVAEGLGES
jgi:CHASE1-domain containing sensor protein